MDNLESPVSLRAFLKRKLGESARAAGISATSFLDGESLPPFIERYPEAASRYGLDRTGLVMTAALAFGEGLGPDYRPEASSTRPLARLGRFARANWYAELLDRLTFVSRSLRESLAAAGRPSGRAGDWRRLVNSGLPERPLALASGLGRPGRSGLLLVPGFGPGVVIGLLLLPREAAPPIEVADRGAVQVPVLPARGEGCGNCRACIDACPTGALDLDKGYDRMLCIQHWSSREGDLPPLVATHWGDRLYGCDECTVSCPRFEGRAELNPVRGLLGPGLPAEEIAEASDEALRERLRGSALGMSWISPAALRRNARLALATTGSGKRTAGPPI